MKKIFNLLMVAVTAMFLLNSCACTVIDNSEVGLKFKKFGLTDQGKLNAEPATGYVFYNPFTERVFSYPVYVQRVNYEAFEVNTKDAAIFLMDPVLAYELKREKAVDVFTTYRKPLNEIEQGYMKTCIYDAYRQCANVYTADELMSHRAEFEQNVRSVLDRTLGDEGFLVREFTSKIDPPKSLRETIDAKNAAVQAALKAENLVKEAEANAQIKIANARGEAEATKIQADGEAYYNRTVAASLNELLVRQYAIEKWNGELPAYNGGGAVPFINMK